MRKLTMAIALTALTLGAVLTLTQKTLAQAPIIQWNKSFGGSSYDNLNSIEKTNDGGYIIAGQTLSHDGDVTGINDTSNWNLWVLKIDSVGNIQWEKCLGGPSYDAAYSVKQTNDGGYIVSGVTRPWNLNATGGNGRSDYWVIKLNSKGKVKWKKYFGGSWNEFAQSIQQTTDGGYIVSGYSSSNDSDVTGHHGSNPNYDFWVVKLSSTGNIEWQKSVGGNSNDESYSIQQTMDGGYITTGTSSSNDGDVSGNHGGDDFWVVKLNNSGNIEWQKSLGGSGDDYYTWSVKQTVDSGYIVCGATTSNDGDVTNFHGGWDCWIVKISSTGNIEWQKSLGGSGTDYGFNAIQMLDSGYLVAGYSNSHDGDLFGNNGAIGGWIVKLDITGNIIWQKILFGTDSPIWYNKILQISSTSFVVGGTGFDDFGSNAVCVTKLSFEYPEKVKIPYSNNNLIQIYPNPVTDNLNIKLQEGSSESQIFIYDLMSKVVYESKYTQSTNINVGNLSPGIYFIKIQNHFGQIVRKVIKE